MIHFLTKKIGNFVTNNMLLHHIYTWQKTFELQQAQNFHLKKKHIYYNMSAF